MNDQRDILDAAKEMPSSLNDACRTIEVMADEITRLRAALREIIDAEKEFREQMGADWEGDPVSDACDRAKLLLADEEGKS